jgi:excisionase family DNA binding protein
VFDIRSYGQTERWREVDKLLSPADLAQLLEVPRSRIYEWNYRRSGPPAIRVGKHVRYREADVERWLRERQKAS